MNREFHYFCIYYLANEAGFSPEDSAILAVSSQLVDESTLPWKIEGRKAATGTAAHPMFTETTQEYSFWDPDVCRSIYRPFHFLPGERHVASARRKDGASGPRAVTADSPLSREVLIAAFKTDSLYRMGIALHSYADTWAHQDFSADDEIQNSLGVQALPSVGHLQALKAPDDPLGRWSDPRLLDEYSEVDNAQRFLRAARMIFRFLRTYLRRSFADEDLVLGPLEELWKGQRHGRAKAEARDSDYIVDLGIPPYEAGLWVREASGAPYTGVLAELARASSGYDSFRWLTSAAAKRSEEGLKCAGTIDAEAYSASRLRLWNEAAAAHRAFCFSLFSRRGFG
ncbi:MAG TPA: DUF6765 family protein [Rectinemataceae bacterium]